MAQSANDGRETAFSRWLRTGRLPRTSNPDEVEYKFNPWHNPRDGQFTFAGSGHFYAGAGAGQKLDRHTSAPSPRSGHRRQSKAESRGATTVRGESRLSGKPARISGSPASRSTNKIQSVAAASLSIDRPEPVAEFVAGVGEGLYQVGAGTVVGVYSILTTNPLTTVQNVGIGEASTIDAALVADATPMTVHIARATHAVRNASAHDWGKATGLVAGNVVVTAVPGAVISKVSAFRAARSVASETVYNPPQINWVKETFKSTKAWKAYNDAATGARPGYAPALTRKMADGSTRLVKFDGIHGDHVIDRKWKVTDAPNARAQVLRQSEALAQHGKNGMWEVPTLKQKIKAQELLQKMGVTNIKVRVVKPR